MVRRVESGRTYAGPPLTPVEVARGNAVNTRLTPPQRARAALWVVDKLPAEARAPFLLTVLEQIAGDPPIPYVPTNDPKTKHD